jgi:hydroxymethylglutaryl-CoA lyase
VSFIDALPKAVTVYEVGPRDGLQNEANAIPLEAKLRFIDLLSQAGLPFIEVTSFVRPGAIPQLADAELVVKSLHSSNTRYTALVPNMRGMERAVRAGLYGIALFTAASETFNQKNTNASIDESIERFIPVVALARRENLWVRAYVSTSFGCPYEGDVPIGGVVAVTRRLAELGADEIVVSDTIGVATPGQVSDVVSRLLEELPRERIALHFHDTRGTALANVLAGLERGITTFDSSAGGLGGCPFAPGATGNLATEDLVYMLNGMGIETGVSLDGVVAASAYVASILKRPPPSRYFQAATA